MNSPDQRAGRHAPGASPSPIRTVIRSCAMPVRRSARRPRGTPPRSIGNGPSTGFTASRRTLAAGLDQHLFIPGPAITPWRWSSRPSPSSQRRLNSGSVAGGPNCITGCVILARARPFADREIALVRQRCLDRLDQIVAIIFLRRHEACLLGLRAGGEHQEGGEDRIAVHDKLLRRRERRCRRSGGVVEDDAEGEAKTGPDPADAVAHVDPVPATAALAPAARAPGR